MRISRTGSQIKSGPVRKSRSSNGTDFTPEENKGDAKADAAGSAAASAATGGVASVGAVDAVLALQGVDSVEERQSRALRKGRRLLDALDRLNLSFLENDTSHAHLNVLKRAIGEVRSESGDAGLDDALDHIEVRAAVEIAKLEQRRQAK